LSHGELNGQISDGVLADTVEAFIGAIYLDQGQKRVDRFIVDNILILLQRIIDQSDYIDAKSKLHDHAKNFKVGVLIDGQIVSTGSGGSKQIAEQDAAERALHYFKKNR